MNEKNSTTVEIFGREYKIKGVADDEYIQRVARFVDEKMREVSSGSSYPTQDRLAILTALNIADELFQERDAASDACSRLERKTDNLISAIDESLQSEV